MAFGALCDGYVVVHAHLVNAPRKALFQAEMERVGIDQVTVVHGVPITEDDPALPRFKGNKGHVSLLRTNIAVIDQAAAAGWRSVALFEDDIVFRKDFYSLWGEVEVEILGRHWDMLTLHRGPMKKLLLKEPRGRTYLMPIRHNLWAQCVVVRESGYDTLRRAYEWCLEKGHPADFIYGYFTDKGKRLLTTSRNLTGQRGGLTSSITTTKARRDNFYETFRSCRTWFEYGALKSAYAMRRLIRSGR